MRWYSKDGKIVTTIKGKNGKDRAPTIKDARANGFIPSVTTILDLIAKPALVNYFVREAIKAAYNNQWALKKKENEAVAILTKISKEESEKARDFGTKIHDHVERFLKSEEGETIEMEGDIKEFVEPVFDYIVKNNIKGVSEEAVIIDIDGNKAAGTLDNMDDITIRDIKTQRTKGGKFTLYDSWLWQLSAYNVAANRDKGEIIAISSTEPNQIQKFEFDKEQLEFGRRIFALLLEFFYITRGLK